MLNPFKNLGKRQLLPGKAPGQVDYDTLVKALAARANQGASWAQMLAYLRNRRVSPGQVAQWMTKYGGQWVRQSNPELGQGLRRLSEVASGELAVVAATLGWAIAEQSHELDTPTAGTEFPGSWPNSSPSEPKSDQSLTPDPTILAEVEAYLRGDLNLTESNSSAHFQNLVWPKQWDSTRQD